jgi:hypothetical protein
MDFFTLLPLELKVELFEKFLKDRLNLLRCVCSDWQLIVDKNVRKVLKRKTNDLVYFESTSLDKFGQDMGLIKTSNLKVKALQTGIPLNLSQLYPITVEMVIELAKKGDIESLNELSRSWPFVKSKWFVISSNLSTLAKSLLFECKSDEVFNWFLSHFDLFIRPKKTLVENVDICLSSYSIDDSMMEYDAKLIASRLKFIGTKPNYRPLRNCIFDLSKGFTFQDLIDYEFNSSFLVNYYSKIDRPPHDHVLLDIVKNRNLPRLHQYFTKIRSYCDFYSIKQIIFSTFFHYLSEEQWFVPFNEFPEMLSELPKKRLPLDDIVKHQPHLLTIDDLYDHFLKTNDFLSMKPFMMAHHLTQKLIPLCSLPMFRVLFDIDDSESNYSARQLHHLMLLNEHSIKSWDHTTKIREGRRLQELFENNKLHFTISFKGFISYLIEVVGKVDTLITELDIEILESFVKYFKQYDERVLMKFLDGLSTERTEIVGLLLNSFVSKCVSDFPLSKTLNTFYQDLVDSVLTMFHQCDKYLVDYLKKMELRPQKSRFHLIKNCVNLATLIYLLESGVLLDLKFHEIMEICNQLMKKDRLDVFTKFLNQYPNTLKTISSESDRIELFLYYPSNQYKDLVHEYFKSFGIFVTDIQIKE